MHFQVTFASHFCANGQNWRAPEKFKNFSSLLLKFYAVLTQILRQVFTLTGFKNQTQR
jgi:hypothetical protein